MDKLVALAVLPGIVLMIYIYKKDRREKEPLWLLLSCFFLGALTVIPAGILESLILGSEEAEKSAVQIIVECIFCIGLIEELVKYLVLKWRTFKNKNFDYSFDGIVYSVFVSLGFAVAENVFYVVENGLTVGLMRAVTAVPGHMCFAVLMGYFYSGKRFAKNYDRKREHFKYSRNVVFVPMVVHGIYDALAMIGSTLSLILWLAFVITMFVFCFKLVKKASDNDTKIAINPLSAEYEELAWRCPQCGVYVRTNFCGECGTKRP